MKWHTWVNNWSSHVVYRKSWALWNDICRCRVRKVSCQLEAVGVRVSWQSLRMPAMLRSTGPPVEYLQPRSSSAKWGLKSNSVLWSREEVKGRYSSLSLSPSVRLSHTLQRSDFYRKNKKTYIFSKRGVALHSSLWGNRCCILTYDPAGLLK